VTCRVTASLPSSPVLYASGHETACRHARRGAIQRIANTRHPSPSPQHNLPFSGTARLVVDLGTARIKPLASGGHRARGCRRRQTGAAGQEGGRAPWRQDGFRQTAVRVVRRTTPLECGEGKRRRVVSRRRHSGRGCRAVACSRPLEMREDPCGVLDRSDQLHPARAARTAQDVQVKGYAVRPASLTAAEAYPGRSSLSTQRHPRG